MSFVYDSLDTVKTLKFPSKKEVKNLTFSIFVIVVISGLLFVWLDTLFSGLYKSAYYIITG